MSMSGNTQESSAVTVDDLLRRLECLKNADRIPLEERIAIAHEMLAIIEADKTHAEVQG